MLDDSGAHPTSPLWAARRISPQVGGHISNKANLLDSHYVARGEDIDSIRT